MKKLKILFLIPFFVVNIISSASNIESTTTTSSTIGLKDLQNVETRIKTKISANKLNYYYDLFGREKYEYFPLQLGNGEYFITIFKNIIDNKYRVVESNRIKEIKNNILEVFRSSVQNINWNKDMDVIKKATELTKGKKNDKEKITVIYNYIIKNFNYDYEKINKITSDYVPNIETIYSEKKGICYDYASIFASMCRSQKIPVKLIKGYTKNVKEYHAWNEVYVDKKWQVIDTTFDSVYIKAGHKVKMFKDAKLYKASAEY